MRFFKRRDSNLFEVSAKRHLSSVDENGALQMDLPAFSSCMPWDTKYTKKRRNSSVRGLWPHFMKQCPFQLVNPPSAMVCCEMSGRARRTEIERHRSATCYKEFGDAINIVLCCDVVCATDWPQKSIYLLLLIFDTIVRERPLKCNPRHAFKHVIWHSI